MSVIFDRKMQAMCERLNDIIRKPRLKNSGQVLPARDDCTGMTKTAATILEPLKPAPSSSLTMRDSDAASNAATQHLLLQRSNLGIILKSHTHLKLEEKTMTTTKTTSKQTTDTATGVASQLAQAGKALVSGTIEVDKMILGQIRSGAKVTVEHGRSLLAAKDIKTAVDLQVGFVQNSIEQGVANTREVLEFSQSKLRDVMSPFRKSA